MVKNYMTIAIRHLFRQKLYAFINIFGLALGIACCLLMALFVKHEWSYDRFHEKKDRIYRVLERQVNPDGEVTVLSLHPLSTVEPLVEAFPGVVRASGFMWSQVRISGGGHTFQEQFGEVHPGFLKMFSFPLLAGDAETVLKQPNEVVISTSMARKFFGELQPDYRNVLGQTLTFHGKKDRDYLITGVMQDVPEHSSLPFDLLISISHYKHYGRHISNDGFTSVYVEFAERQDVAGLEAVMLPFVETHLADRVHRLRKYGYIHKSTDGYTLQFQPLTEVYWNALSRNSYERRGNPFAAYLLAGIAVLVLLIACSNFMALSIGRSAGRALEVGIRKVMGAHRGQLMQQFWGEAVLLSFFALGVGLALAELFLPVFNNLVQKPLQIAYFEDGLFVVLTVGMMVAVGLVAGSYPALVLSGLQPVASLKGQTRIGGRSHVTRSLVVLQYAASIALMICTGVMMEQQRFIRNKDLGYDKEQVVVVETRGFDRGRQAIAARYKQAILSHHQVMNATVSDRTFTSGSANTGYSPRGGSKVVVRHLQIDADYVETMGLKLLKGRNFSADRDTDSTRVILVNEALVKAVGLSDPVGETLEGLKYKVKDPMIIGVVGDFHTGSLYETIPPLAMHLKYGSGSPRVLVRIRPDDVPGTLVFLQETWKRVAPGWTFRHSFLDQNLNEQYQKEERWQDVLQYSSVFAIAISCLGMLGLAALAASRRTKEIGIRKILGASVPNLVGLLSKDFVKLLLASNVIAWPVAYMVMNKWLQNFAYRMDLSIGVFVLGGVMAVFIALVTVSTQAVKVALANPVDALRDE